MVSLERRQLLKCGLLLLGAGCDAPPRHVLSYQATPEQDQRPVFEFAVHPLHNPGKLIEAYQPLIAHLNQQLPDIEFRLEASRDYAAYEQKIRDRRPAFLLPNPWQTLLAQKFGYHVLAEAGDRADFRGIFIVRRDSQVRQPGDLDDRTIAYPSPTALAAAIMPQFFLHQHGLSVTRDVRNIYVGSQESAIMNVFLGQADAGATWPPPWRQFQLDHPEKAAQLKVIWETPPLINNSVMVRDDVPAKIFSKVQQLLIDLTHHPAGSQVLAPMQTAGFAAADDSTYAIVADYVARFEREVRPVEDK
ncbi:MAG: PhnD/SsuA/transferrin family substrate-binding protein [Dechloromonas sp.]|nr:PhnD/SsuA/transferrin family substrate-binding protein [Dechloromonas sp.]